MKAHSPRPWSGAIWAAITLVMVGGWIFWGAHWRETAWDFTMFYVAAHTPISSIHDQGVFQDTARHALQGTGVTYASPYVRPAVFALALRWMRFLSYWNAYGVWACLQFLFYGATIWTLRRHFRAPVAGFYAWALFFPVFFGIITGQDMLAMGLVLCLALVELANGREETGGALLSLTLYKFNLFLPIPVYLALRKRHRALAAYALCGAALAGISALLEPPSVYLRLLPEIQRHTIGFTPKSMLGLRGLFATAGWTGAYPVAALALCIYLLAVSRRMEFIQGFGMAVIASLLCAYHVTWYDGAALAVPFGLALARGSRDLRLMTTCLMVVPFWNATSVLITVLLLGFAALYANVFGKAAPQSAKGSAACAG